MATSLAKATELGFAEFASTLISETLNAVVTSILTQKKQAAQLEQQALLTPEEYAAENLTDDIVKAEVIRLFPSSGVVDKSGVDAGELYASKYCKKVILVKWNEDLWSMLNDDIVCTSTLLKYRDLVYQNLKDAPKAQKIIKKFQDEIKRIMLSPLSDAEIQKRTVIRLSQDFDLKDAEKMLSSKVLDNIHSLIIKEFLTEKVHTLLIDMPDYSQKGSWKINKDLDGVGALWSMLKNTSDVNILVCLQQELVLKQPHLILGKMDKIILKTLTVDQLLEAYGQFFENYEPFIEDALRLIAKLSRGVFRRFKNYVRLCLEVASMDEASEGLITVESVKRAVTKEQLKMDMDLELSEFFKNQERKLQAFNILDFARENHDVSQKVISDALGLHPNAVGDIVRQLCLHDYLQVKRGKGTELLVSLKE